MRRNRARPPLTTLCACTVLLALAACNQVEPYTRAGEWHPLGANAANTRAMLADPNDLYEGRGSVGAPGDLAAAAVARLRADAVRPLPASGVADVRPTDTGSQQAAGAGPSASAPVSAQAAAGAAQGGAP